MRRLFYCSFRDTVSSTSVCRSGGPSLVGLASGDGRSRKITPAGRGEHGFGDGGERKNLRGGAEFDRLARHAVDHAGGFILRDGAGAGLAHLQQPLRAIGTHAGEQHADRVGPAASATEENSTSTDGRW